MSECNHDCSNCSQSCAERDPNSFLKKPNEQAHIKKVIGIASGKGGVGKSMVTSLLAIALRRKGYNVAVLDADITGPSMAKTFGLKAGNMTGDQYGIDPALTRTGIEVMSLNLLVDKETEPVVWRGPVLANMVTQFWTDVYWGDVDYMLVDLPPGTGDVVLTVYQSIPLSGVIVVSTPQELVGMIVEKAVNMCNMMNLPIIGLAENMSFIQCPNCEEKIEVFGESHVAELADKYVVEHFARLPINPELAKAVDNATLEEVVVEEIDELVTAIEEAKTREV